MQIGEAPGDPAALAATTQAVYERHGDMRTLDLPVRFDGIIGWNSFFHLMPDEQRALLPRLAGHLGPGAH